MFTFADTPVKFVGLLILFLFCTAWCTYELTRPQSGRQRVSNALHWLMAVVMLLMVAPVTWMALTSVLPTTAWAVIFGLATCWFVYLAVHAAQRHDRPGAWHGLGHATMFAAMTWHLAAMAVMASLRSPMGGSMDHGSMTASGPRMMLAVIGLPLMVYLLVAAVRALIQAVRPSSDASHGEGGESCHAARPKGSVKARLAHLSDVAMNAGMFWMSTGLMVPLLPFMAALAF